MAFDDEIERLRTRVAPLAKFLHAISQTLEKPNLSAAPEHLGFRYENPQLIQFCLLRGVRVVSALNASIELARGGYSQEIGVILRTMIEYASQIDFMLARCHRWLKIGWSETPYNRADHLNAIGYGQIYDWELLYYGSYPEAGKVELSVHSRLSWCMIPRGWVREGVPQDAREIFKCSYTKARETIKAVAGMDGKSEWEAHWVKRRLYEPTEAKRSALTEARSVG